MSGEYGGWGIVTVLFLATNSRTSNEVRDVFENITRYEHDFYVIDTVVNPWLVFKLVVNNK